MSKKTYSREMFDEFAARKQAEKIRQAEYQSGLKKNGVAVTPTGVDVAFILRFFADRVAEFDAGTVVKYDFPIWETIGYVLSFNMEYLYSYIDWDGVHEPDVRKDLCGTSDVLPASTDQSAIGKGLESYLVAAAALARRIGSSTYDGWRSLLLKVEFEQRHGVFVFASENAFDDFLKKLMGLIQVLWADEEIFSHLESVKTRTQNDTPHPQKQA